ncbi:hypothetical protein [Streptomyces sp. NRRL B-24720]|nr:hypothetical protein [Streptomyces sp. NRRL B-24720]
MATKPGRTHKQGNFVRLVFCEPAIRALYLDWDRVAQTTLAQRA